MPGRWDRALRRAPALANAKPARASSPPRGRRGSGQFLASQAIRRMRAARVLVGARRAAAARRFLATSDGRRLALSFSGSGMMMAYHFGVAAAIAEKSSLMDRVDRVHGTSGGAIVSLVLLEAPEAIRDCLEHYVSGEFFEELRAREVLKPHDVLLKRTLDAVGVTRDGAAGRLSGKLVAHTTTFEDGLLRPRNNSLRTPPTTQPCSGPCPRAASTPWSACPKMVCSITTAACPTLPVDATPPGRRRS